MSRPLLLDLYCCEGGAAMGYYRAGFDVIGVDIEPQPNYPFEFVQADALELLRWMNGDGCLHRNGRVLPSWSRSSFAAVHASPPCQRYSTSTASTGRRDDHPDLIGPVREALELWSWMRATPYVIENVEGSPLRRDLVLCGSMFGMQVRRHRVFELGGWMTWGAPTCRHAEMARRGPTIDVTGHAGGRNQTIRDGYPVKYFDREHARDVMRMPWASARGCTEAIPPAYTEWIGNQLLSHVRAAA